MENISDLCGSQTLWDWGLVTVLIGRLFFLNSFKLLIGYVVFICWDSRKPVWNDLVPVAGAGWDFFLAAAALTGNAQRFSVLVHHIYFTLEHYKHWTLSDLSMTIKRFNIYQTFTLQLFYFQFWRVAFMKTVISLIKMQSRWWSNRNVDNMGPGNWDD